jgi:hypothetical protein
VVFEEEQVAQHIDGFFRQALSGHGSLRYRHHHYSSIEGRKKPQDAWLSGIRIPAFGPRRRLVLAAGTRLPGPWACLSWRFCQQSFLRFLGESGHHEVIGLPDERFDFRGA